MALIDKYCLVAEREGYHKIIHRSALYMKKGKKWIHPNDSTINNNLSEFYAAMEDGAKKRVLKVVAVGALNELRAITMADGKRIPVRKRQTFSPHGVLTKTKAREVLHIKGKQLQAAERRAFTKAQDDAQRSADRVYSDMVSTSKHKETDDGDNSPSNDSSQVSHYGTTPISARVQIPVSGRVQTPVSATVASMPRSLTCYDLNQGSASSTPIRGTKKYVSRIRHPYIPTPSVAHTQTTDKEASGIRKAIEEASKPMMQKFKETVGNLQNAVVDQLLKINTNLGVIRSKIITVDDIALMFPEHERPRPPDRVARNEVSSQDEEIEDLVPDAEGMVEIITGIRCSYETYMAALLAKTCRRRANAVFKMLWPDTVIRSLYVGRGPGARHRAQSTPTTVPETLATRDYIKINAVCDALQRAKPVPNRMPGDSLRENVRAWAADWLKNRRYRLSKLPKDDSAATDSESVLP